MNYLNEEDFWRELFVLKMRREERRIAALPANSQRPEDEQAASSLTKHESAWRVAHSSSIKLGETSESVKDVLGEVETLRWQERMLNII
jgi:hypothetical protein